MKLKSKYINFGGTFYIGRTHLISNLKKRNFALV